MINVPQFGLAFALMVGLLCFYEFIKSIVLGNVADSVGSALLLVVNGLIAYYWYWCVKRDEQEFDDSMNQLLGINDRLMEMLSDYHHAEDKTKAETNGFCDLSNAVYPNDEFPLDDSSVDLGEGANHHD